MNEKIDNTQERGADLRHELDKLEVMLGELKVLYEQFFLGVLTLPPDKSHTMVKMALRRLRKAPFKSSALAYRLRSIENRYSTLFTYWQRVLREREEGVYARDVFKAHMREKNALEDQRAGTVVGAAEKQMHNLFDTYREALEKSTGRKHTLNFDSFQESLLKRAKDFKEKHGSKKLAFKVVMKDGKVTLQARVKE